MTKEFAATAAQRKSVAGQRGTKVDTSSQFGQRKNGTHAPFVGSGLLVCLLLVSIISATISATAAWGPVPIGQRYDLAQQQALASASAYNGALGDPRLSPQYQYQRLLAGPGSPHYLGALQAGAGAPLGPFTHYGGPRYRRATPRKTPRFGRR